MSLVINRPTCRDLDVLGGCSEVLQTECLWQTQISRCAPLQPEDTAGESDITAAISQQRHRHPLEFIAIGQQVWVKGVAQGGRFSASVSLVFLVATRGSVSSGAVAQAICWSHQGIGKAMREGRVVIGEGGIDPSHATHRDFLALHGSHHAGAPSDLEARGACLASPASSPLPAFVRLSGSPLRQFKFRTRPTFFGLRRATSARSSCANASHCDARCSKYAANRAACFFGNLRSQLGFNKFFA